MRYSAADMPRFTRLTWLLGAWLVLAAPPGRPAAAAPPASADPKTRESPRTYYEKATSAFGLGDYDKAAELYEKAFQLRADPALLYDAAQAHRAAGHKERAIELYRNYIRLFPDAKQVPDARRHIDELQTGAVVAPPPSPGPTLVPDVPAGAPQSQPAPPAPSTPSNLTLTPMSPPPASGPTAQGSDLTRAAPPPDATPDGRKRSRTWLWIAVGGAAVVAGAVTTAVLLGGSSHDPTPTLGVVKESGAP